MRQSGQRESRSAERSALWELSSLGDGLRGSGYAHCWKRRAVSLSERSHSPKRDAVCSAEVLALLDAGGCGADELDAWREGAPAHRIDGYRRSQASARGRSGATLRGEETLRDWKGDAYRPEREAQPKKLPANGLTLEVRRDDPVPERRKLESRRGEAEWLERVSQASGPRLERQDANPEAPTRNPKAHDANPKAYPATRRVHGADREAKTNNPQVRWL